MGPCEEHDPVHTRNIWHAMPWRDDSADEIQARLTASTRVRPSRSVSSRVHDGVECPFNLTGYWEPTPRVEFRKVLCG